MARSDESMNRLKNIEFLKNPEENEKNPFILPFPL
jgi:hypothetical protein